MSIKLPKSRVQISGQIKISWNDGIEHHLEIGLNALNQSKSGVYEIRNKFNGKRYIGMAKDLNARKRHHWCDLLAGKHASKEMQEDFDYKTGKNIDLDAIKKEHLISPDWMFEFNVIIYCYPSQLTFYENLLITYLQPEYNTRKKKFVRLEKKFDEEGNPNVP